MPSSVWPETAAPSLNPGVENQKRDGAKRGDAPIHPLFVRLTHWINAVAMIVMIMSGLQIHNAFPILPGPAPEAVTLGGWLGGATRWHFAAMWILVANGLAYLVYGLWTGRFRRKFLPLTPRMAWRDLRDALTGKLGHQDLSVYNAVQKLLYMGVIAAGMVAVLSGVAIWKPVQFGWLTALLGDFDRARIVHFAAMSTIVLFLVVHVAMAILVPRSLKAIILGR